MKACDSNRCTTERSGFGSLDGEHGVGDPSTGGDDELSV